MGFKKFALKLAEVKPIIWPRLARLLQVRSTAEGPLSMRAGLHPATSERGRYTLKG
jgi:hypothetical protein